MRAPSLPLLLLALTAASFLARTPTLVLPLEGRSARLASVADDMGHERAFALRGFAPLLPMMLSVPVAAGAPATQALRVVDTLLGTLVAPLLCLLALRLGLARRTALTAGLLSAIHPLLLLGAGGVAPGTGSLMVAMLLAGLCSILASSPGPRRVGGALALILPLADPTGFVYMPALLVAWLVVEPAGRVRTMATALAVGMLLFGPAIADLGLRGHARLDGPGALVAFALATLVVLAPFVLRGLRDLATLAGRPGFVARLWILAGAAHLLALVVGYGSRDPTLSTLARALALLPLLVLACTAGLQTAAAPIRRWAPRTAVLLAAGLGAWSVAGGLQTKLLPGHEGRAGRLHLLRTALDAAADAAGRNGWIVLALADTGGDEQASLADLKPAHWTWSRGPRADAEEAVRRPLPFPAAAFEPGQSFAVLADARTARGVATFGGAGIFHQDLVRQIGPYVILRARKP